MIRSFPLCLILLGSVCLPGLTQTVSVQPSYRFNLNTSTSSYRLGPGDTIDISCFNVPEIKGTIIILSDGTITLPLVGSLSLSGLSQEQAAAHLDRLYQPYLEKPLFTVTVATPRPTAFTILGEVNRPGPYTLNSSTSTSATNQSVAGNKIGTGQGITNGLGGGRLTVSQALNLAGGVTELADVENITLVRRLPGGESVERKVNLWKMLQTADSSEDLAIMDGDGILVAKADPDRPSRDAEYLSSTTLAPATVEVKILGEVNRPGVIQVAPNAPLTDALVAAGGLTEFADPRVVQMIRLNRDGSVTRLSLVAALEQGRDPQKNPSLRRGDLIVVQRSFGGSLARTLQSLLPLNFLLQLFR
ncbi:MAG: SLBB domain-containing protein [Anaerolineae bacterium]|nr:SLBB domain-containing protein [Gloeobacterales cyanobacterium ES-bin-313]